MVTGLPTGEEAFPLKLPVERNLNPLSSYWFDASASNRCLEPGRGSEVSGRTLEEQHKVIPPATSSKKTVSLGAQLKCLYTNVCSMGNEQGELEVLVKSHGCITDLSETGQDDLHAWDAGIDGYRLCRTGRQGRRGDGIAMYTRERLDCMELGDGNKKVECLCLRVRGKANETDIMVGVCYRAPSQDEEAD